MINDQQVAWLRKELERVDQQLQLCSTNQSKLRNWVIVMDPEIRSLLDNRR